MNEPRRVPSRGFSLRVLVGACLLLLPGCQGMPDRLHDAGQIFDLTVTTGAGMAAGIRLTEAAQLGWGSTDGNAYGWVDGRPVALREQRHEFGASLLYIYEYRRTGDDGILDMRHPRWGDPGFREYPWSFQQLTDRKVADVGFNIHVAWLGINFAVHLDELGDFFAGLVGFDPLGDDAHERSLDSLIEQAHSLDARERAAAFDALLRRGEDIHGYAIYSAKGVRTRTQREAMEAVGK